MRIELEGGEHLDVDDEQVREYVKELDGGAEDGNAFIFGIHVNHAHELPAMGEEIAAFVDKLGGGNLEVRVSVNEKLNAFKDKVVGFDVEAIGYAEETEYDYDIEEEDE